MFSKSQGCNKLCNEILKYYNKLLCQNPRILRITRRGMMKSWRPKTLFLLGDSNTCNKDTNLNLSPDFDPKFQVVQHWEGAGIWQEDIHLCQPWPYPLLQIKSCCLWVYQVFGCSFRTGLGRIGKKYEHQSKIDIKTLFRTLTNKIFCSPKIHSELPTSENLAWGWWPWRL